MQDEVSTDVDCALVDGFVAVHTSHNIALDCAFWLVSCIDIDESIEFIVPIAIFDALCTALTFKQLVVAAVAERVLVYFLH